MKKSFLNNIKRGLGKAYIELRDCNNKNDYLETLIFACLHDCSYELMFEGPKSEYLFKMIKLYDHSTQNKIKDLIVHSLDIKDSGDLIFQKLDLLMCFYFEGKKDVLNEISNFSDKYMNETNRWDKYRLSAFEIVAIIIDRAFGIKKTRTILSFIEDKKLNKDYFGWYYTKISMRYKNNRIIKQFHIPSYTNENKNENMTFSLDNLLNSNNRFYISCFANRIDKFEYDKTIEYLENTNNIEHIKKILLAFSEGKLNNPLPIQICLDLLTKYGNRISSEVYDVLKYYKSPFVRTLGLKLVKEKDYLTKGLVMLFNNYSKDDLKRIVDGYNKIVFSFNGDDSITYETINFMNHKKKNYPDEILYINYKKSYNSFYREYIVDIMKKRNLLTPSIIEECKYDFDFELSKKVNKWE